MAFQNRSKEPGYPQPCQLSASGGHLNDAPTATSYNAVDRSKVGSIFPASSDGRLQGAAVSEPNEDTFRFLDFPRELRDTVYSNLLEGTIEMKLWNDKGRELKIVSFCLPKLRLVNRQFKEEYEKVAFTRAVAVVRHHEFYPRVLFPSDFPSIMPVRGQLGAMSVHFPNHTHRAMKLGVKPFYDPAEVALPPYYLNSLLARIQHVKVQVGFRTWGPLGETGWAIAAAIAHREASNIATMPAVRSLKLEIHRERCYDIESEITGHQQHFVANFLEQSKDSISAAEAIHVEKAIFLRHLLFSIDTNAFAGEEYAWVAKAGEEILIEAWFAKHPENKIVYRVEPTSDPAEAYVGASGLKVIVEEVGGLSFAQLLEIYKAEMKGLAEQNKDYQEDQED
ncbi:hypothetical protein LTR85_000765 [Meristemomyces frigidus]|nr:hypothetical protein LTR85_000765 [Meristemomyces frigidus]